jgi:cell division cycle 20-like protein 1, cofactor of APC complex
MTNKATTRTRTRTTRSALSFSGSVSAVSDINSPVKFKLAQQQQTQPELPEQDDVIMVTTTSSPDRCQMNFVQTSSPTCEASTPMSTCSSTSAATTTTTTTTSSSSSSSSSSTDDDVATNFYSNPSPTVVSSSLPTSCTTTTVTSSCSIRVPLPSPSRGRLDRQYAKRLAATTTTSVYYKDHASPLAKRSYFVTPTPTILSSSNKTLTTTTSQQQQQQDLIIMKPPEIAREHCDHSFFRPTSILTTKTYYSTGTEPIQQHQAPRQFFFPSTPKEERFSSQLDSYDYPTSTKSNPNNYVSSCRRQRFINNNTTSSSCTTRTTSDLGTSDRFIPSRATSNMKVNLWDSSLRGGAGGRGDSSYSSFSSDMNDHPRTSNHNHHHNNNNNTNMDGSNHRRNHTVAGATSDDGIGASTTTTTATTTSSSSTDGHIGGGRTNDMTPNNTTQQQNLHNMLLRSELLGENVSPYASSSGASSWNGNSSRIGTHTGPQLQPDGFNRLRFHSPRQAFHDTVFHNDDILGPTAVVNSFSLVPFGTASSQRLMAAPQKRRRKIAKVPFKVLDAPALQDDFYLNLVDWSSQNVLAVGLGSCVYLWSACTSKVTKLCDLASTDDLVTSVAWAQRGVHLAVGTNKGETQLWDTIKVKKIKTMAGHSARVGTLAWSGPILASGSRDRLIFLRDVRCSAPFTERLTAHRQEVCGLRWSFDEPAFLASGGNDNQLHVVDSRHPIQPVHRFSDHTAAVKAIAWSPHQHGLLASGGGTADRCIRFWNTLSGSSLCSVDTGSQVCNLAWSQNCNEIVSTHGYSLNQIVVWRYPSLNKVVTLTGHTYRVLYLAVSPDGSTIVTGAGDETLRFWQVFPGPRSDVKNSAGGLLFPNTLGSVIR